MIEIKNLSKDFFLDGKKFKAVDDVSLKVNEGEIFGIIGLSGAGKSTLVRCINRLEEAQEGQILIEGQDILSLGQGDLSKLRKNIGMIFQHFNLLEQRTVFENISFPLELEAMPKADRIERVEALLDFVDLKDKRNSYPSQLSGGQKQRVAIARSIANKPKILLSDEGTSALDPKTTKSILKLLKKVRDEMGVTIIMITHQMEVVQEICQRVAIMDRGKIVELNSVEEVFANPKTQIAKSFVDSQNLQEEIIRPEDFKGQLIRVSFLGDSSKQPIISKLIRSSSVDVNILSGNINKLQETSVGHLILELLGPDKEIQEALNFLQKEGLNLEVIK